MEDQATQTAPPIDDGKKLSVDDFAKTIKTKFPAYQSKDNKELVDAWLKKYPVYSDKVDLTPKKASGAGSPPTSPNLGRGIPTALYLSKASPIPYTPAYEAAHDDAIQRAKTVRANTPQATPKKDRGILDAVSEAAYLPAFNQGFNELVTKPLAGANDFIDRTIDKVYQGITGDKTPDWLRKGTGLDNIVKYYDDSYQNREKPKNIVSEVGEGLVGQLPLVASMFTGEGEASMAMKAPQLFGKATKILATTGAANAYKDATDAGKGYVESATKAVEGGEKGAISGMTMDAQMLLGGALGKGAVDKLVEKGLFKGGKATEALLHAVATGTVFSGTDAAEDLLNGKDANWQNSMKLFGMGLAMELPLVAKGITSELQGRSIDAKAAQSAAVATSASNLNAESTLRTLIKTDPKQLAQIVSLPGTHEDLYAQSIEQGAKAYNTEDLSQKRNAYANQLLLKTQGDVKLIASKMADPEQRKQLQEAIQQSEIPDEEKQALLTKIETLTPTENEKNNGESAEIAPAKEQAKGEGSEVEQRPENASEKGQSTDIEENGKGNVKQGGDEPPLKEKEDAIQEQSTGKVGVREQEGVGETVGGRDTEPKKTAEQGKENQKEKIDETATTKENGNSEGKANGERETPGEQPRQQRDGSAESEDAENEVVPPKNTGIKKVISESTRTERNLPEVKLSKLGKDSEVLKQGKEAVDSGKAKPEEIAAKIIDEKRNYSPDEASAMLYYGHQLAQQEVQLRGALGETEPGTEEHTTVLSNLQQLNDQIDQKTQADRMASRSWGNVGNIMQIEADQSFSPAQVRSIISENYGGEIPKDVEARIRTAEKERDKAISDLKKATENQTKQKGKEAVDKIRKSVGLIKQTKAELESEAEDLKTELRKALKRDFGRVNSGIPIPTETLAVLGKLAVNYFKQGVKDFEGLANKLYDDLKETGIEKAQVREYLSTYEPLREESKSRRMELMGRKERSLNKQLETGKLRDYSRKPEIAFKKDEEVIKAEQRIADAEYKIKQEKSKSYRSTEGKYQRSLNWVIRWERRSVLASPMILEKLASAATIGAAVNRIPKQLIGGAFSAILKGIGERAPIEGGLNANAELKFWKEFSNPQKFVNNAWEILKTGASPLTRRFSEKSHEHFAGYDALMDMHAIIKDPPKRATFEASLQYAYNWAAKQGWDISDPLIKKSLESAAFKRAEYEIFQENNGIAKRVNDFINSERKRTDFEATKNFLYRFLIPISTVPLNIARRIGSSIFGLPHGLYEAGKAYRDGIDNLKPEQADYIMRQLKNGSVGLAYYALGMFASKAILGGLWNKDEKDGNKPKMNQAALNEMKTGQYSIDKRIQHAMPLFLTQLGATTARVYNHYLDVPDDDPQYQKMLKSGIQAMAATTGTVVEEIPMIQEPKQAVESLSDPYERKKFGEDLKRRVGFSILNDLGITKKDTETPLDKKLKTATNDDGDKVALSDKQVQSRKAAYDAAIKENKSDWTEDFNDDWESDKNVKQRDKLTTYWHRIGRSDGYIRSKLSDMKQDALDKYIEKQAVEASVEDIVAPEAPKKNTYTIK